MTKCAYCSCKRLDINSYHPHGVTTTTCNYSSKGIKHLWPPEHTETHEHLYTNKTEIKLIFFSPLKPLFLCCLDLYFLINMLSIFNKKQYVSLWHFLYIHNIHTWLLWIPKYHIHGSLGVSIIYANWPMGIFLADKTQEKDTYWITHSCFVFADLVRGASP